MIRKNESASENHERKTHSYTDDHHKYLSSIAILNFNCSIGIWLQFKSMLKQSVIVTSYAVHSTFSSLFHTQSRHLAPRTQPPTADVYGPWSCHHTPNSTKCTDQRPDSWWPLSESNLILSVWPAIIQQLNLNWIKLDRNQETELIFQCDWYLVFCSSISSSKLFR